MAYLARVSYTGNGSTADYALPFTYIASSHIYAWLDNVATTAFTISGSTLTFTTAPSNGVAILIKRVTPTDARLVDFTDGSVLTESDLDQSADQNFYIAQESSDTAQTHLALNNSSLWDADSKRIINVATPTSGTDAANKTYIDTQTTSAATSATAAATSATAAATSATAAATAETNAETAETNAETAETNAETAETNAETAETNATTQASNASTSATSAATSATTATTQASAASTSATAAAGSATTATTQASNASTSATNAATSATSAATSATAAAASLDSFDDVYLGAKGSAPTLDNDGDALTQGDLYYNASGNTLNYYTGSTWVIVTSGGITSVAADSTPQLGGDLDLNSNDITGTGNIAITGYVNARQNWESKSANFVASAGKAYFCDTSGGAIDVTLPSGVIGDTIRFLDATGTFDTNDLTILYGSSKIQGASANLDVSTERAGFTLVYYNSTQGWLLKDK